MSVIPCNPQLFSWSEPREAQNQQQSPIKSIESLPLLMSVSDAQDALGLGRNSIYALLRSGRLKSIRVGRIYKIPRTALEDYLTGY